MTAKKSIGREIWLSIRTLLLAVGIVIAIGAAIFAVGDIACNRTIETWTPVYPNAEVVALDYNFIRPRGMGVTNMTLHSPDDVETVRQWYLDNLTKLSRENAGRGSGTNSWDIDEDPSGQGSLIHLSSRCGQ
jgi:hypothetical protein